MRFSSFLLLAALWAGTGTARAASGPADGPPARFTPTVRKHLIYFTNKAGSPYSLSQPQAYLSARALQRRTRQGISLKARDLPVNPGYVAQVKAVAGARLWYTSRWLNAAVVSCDSTTLAVIRTLSCVQTAETLNRGQAGPRHSDPVETPAPQARPGSAADYGTAYGQAQMIGAVSMHNAGFRGEGMQIAVFDAGFPGVNQIPAFAPLFQEQRIASTFNVVDKTADVYLRNDHGTMCLSTLAANLAGTFIGTAPKATYRLFITEDINSEHPVEEANWLVAAEYADSAGVDVISSSLGYTTFDAPSVDYTYASMNGRTALSSRAAAVAARVGMLVVNSAGNDGNNSWHYISAPADADSILTVGAVDAQRNHASFSSYGPTADGRIKPNVSAQGLQSAIISPAGTVGTNSGTSFSCPILAGMAAGFWQSSPTLSVQQVIQYLQSSGSQSAAPDNTLGYGIPSFVTAYNLAHPNNPLAAGSAATAQSLAIYPNPSQGEELYLQLSPAFQGAPLSVRLFDARGTLVRELPLPATAAPTVRLQPGALALGMYTCVVSAGRAQQTVRFVKR